MTADCTLLSFSVPAPRPNVPPPSPLENGLIHVPTILPEVEVQPSFLVAQIGPGIPHRWFGPLFLRRLAALSNFTPLHIHYTQTFSLRIYIYYILQNYLH